MTRFIKPVKPCGKCGCRMEICETSGSADVWGLSECSNPDCDNFLAVPQLIEQGAKVEYR